MIENSQKEVILFDIGGYFAAIHKHWPIAVQKKIALIVEDTENGHQKHEEQNGPIRTVSVARSPLKDNEDFLVGQSILFSADAILRTEQILLQYMNCSVLGYGKIGKSIAFHLLQRGVKPKVHDINPIKQVEAYNNLCRIPDREKIISESDIIFCATGNKSLGRNDFGKLKDGCFIFSVTSSDDEFDLSLIEGYLVEKLDNHIFRYSSNDNYFYLANNGNAVNFLHGAVMDNFIHLVRSEMLMAPSERENYKTGSINTTTDTLRKKIATAWLSTFNPD